MLKALELAGFKSFADRTRFDFPDGITVVVGPNGSGKSNIVDAMKWVLGSQSAKSLRGKEMSDVIFKGSQTRGPSGSAEVTIVFDNPDGALPVDAPEVRVTRRVFRSGEGEYLINNQAVRLKDIRDLIRGTGIGIDAYSLIEQGKVEKMLNAGAKDRRAIFEEAAGISRFKAKKVEAERRLARVQSNLTRLGDIVDEVASRLKSLRSQASKAERYRQSTERMRELRTSLAWDDWIRLSTEMDQCERELAEAAKRKAEWEDARESMTQRRRSADAQLQTIAESASRIERRRSEIVTQLAAADGRREADRSTHTELRASAAKSLRRVRLLQNQAGSAAAEMRGDDDRLATYQSELAAVKTRAGEIQSRQQAIAAEAEECRQTRDDLNQRQIALARRVSDLETQQNRASARQAEAVRMLANLANRLAVAGESLDSASEAADLAEAKVAALDEDIDRLSREVDIIDSKVAETRRTLDRRREEVSALQVRLEGLVQRRAVLDDLHQRQEGLSGGVRAILQRIQDDSSPLATSVHGLVADCFETDVRVAPLIDAALGPRSQYLVTTGGELQNAIVEQNLEINSRVGLVRIDELPRRRHGDRIRLDGLKGVVGRADRMVRCEAQFDSLVRHLLSSTWLVDNLATALGLRKLSGAGLRFVTSDGELLENDGTVVVGPATEASAGLVSRRSELASAEREIETYQRQIREGQSELVRLSEQLEAQSAELGRAESKHRQAVTDRAAATAEAKHIAAARQAAQRSVDEINTEINSATTTRDAAATDQTRLGTDIRRHEIESEQLTLDLAEADENLSETTAAMQSIGAQVMEVSVDVARAEQRYEALATRVQQRRRDQDQREAAVAEARATFDQSRRRIQDLELSILAAGDRIAELSWDQERADAELAELADQAAEVKRDNHEVIQASEKAIAGAAKAAEAVHSLSSRSENAKLRRETLATRLREDYEIDLHAEEVPEEFVAPENRDACEEEINSLRSQLQRTASVNMEALDELEELQSRYDQLHGQYQDLTAAKDSLQRIIGRINADSRRLFLDTLEAIRVNFQQLYRKSFGGGHADLILEENEDPLEAGVEIVATPPGKPSFSNSLLSGGEKALTAVALLMSIFKYRPSPFCVLDEVDAPFDEANIGRFVTVLSEFLDSSKFVVVTHSKKTMTAATTLYGVTMQESGVSKQVSIRFEDVSDDGEISESAA